MATVKKQYKEVADILKEKYPEAYEAVLPLMKAQRLNSSSEQIFKDENGNLIGRKCSVTDKWFAADRFYTGASAIKEVEKAKNKVYESAKKVEAEALQIMKDARKLDGVDKLAKFEEADAKSMEAEAIRKTASDVKVEFEGGYDTFEEFKASL